MNKHIILILLLVTVNATAIIHVNMSNLTNNYINWTNWNHTSPIPSPTPSPYIDWAGYTWHITNSSWGSINFSDNNVWIDQYGNLHMKITKINRTWYDAEMYSVNTVGYGKYTIGIVSDISVIDKNIDIGSFYWLDNSNELDIEFSKWGDATLYPNVQYTIWTPGGSYESSYIEMDNKTNTTHILNYYADNISFESRDSNGNLIGSWKYSGIYIPKNGGNFYFGMYGIPSNGKEQEIVFSNFSITAIQ